MAGHSARETVTERNKIMGEMNNARFKFRVYVSGRKKTYDVVSIEYRWFNHELETIAAFLGDNEETVEYVTVDCVHNTLEQCTGLKDKNGKLMFEGDIVKTMWNERNPRKGEYQPVEHCFEIYYNGMGFSIRDTDTQVNHVMWESEDFEIVGNIHEGDK